MQLDVAAVLQEVALGVERQASEAAAPEVSLVAVALLVVEGVGQAEAEHGAAERCSEGGFEDEVDVGGHQDEVAHPQAVRGGVGGEQFEIAAVVRIVVKDGLAVVAAREHVVDASLNNQPSGPRGHACPHIVKSNLHNHQYHISGRSVNSILKKM